MLPFANVLDLLVHEFTGLRRGRFSLSFVAPGAFQRFFFRHDVLRLRQSKSDA
jgi:hypothetical protein